MESTFIDPSVTQLTEAIERANRDATYRARTRTCDLGHAPSLAEKILAEPAGHIEDDGGGVAKSYQYPAETSYVLAVWYTDRRECKHVRIAGKRVAARSSSYGRSNGAGHIRSDGWAAVYPERAAKLQSCRIDRCRKAIERVGPAGADDRLAIVSPILIAVGDDGSLLVSDPRRQSAQVVVRDTTTGQRHHITVPPKFVRPDSKTYQRLTADGSRRPLVQAAIAWTFGLAAEEYRPTVQA